MTGTRKRRSRPRTYAQVTYEQRAAGRLDDVSAAGRELYHLLAYLLDRYGTDTYVGRQVDVAAMLRCSDETIAKGQRVLRRAGLLEVEAVHGEKGYRDRSRYSLPQMPVEVRWRPGDDDLPGQTSGQATDGLPGRITYQDKSPTRKIVRVHQLMQ